MIEENKLNLINPNNIDHFEEYSMISNMPFDESIEFTNITEELLTNLSLLPLPPSKFKENKEKKELVPDLIFNNINLGNGLMEYIKTESTKIMLTNAWNAITLTNNWNFVAKDTESFMWSNDRRIEVISKKMEELGYNGHSGSSFGITMRYMQFLAKKGEEEFKKNF